MRGSRLIPLFVSLAAVLVALSACGGDDDDDDDNLVDQVQDAGDEEDDGTPIGDEEVEADDDAEEGDDDGEEGDDDDAGDDVEVCSLLTVEEASELLEEQAAEPEAASETPPFSVCSWAAESDTSFSIIVLQVLTDFPGGAEQYYDNVIEGLNQVNEDFEEIPGLGDEAVYYAGLIQAREGDDLIAVSVTLVEGDEASNRAKSEEAAEIVLGRLD